MFPEMVGDVGDPVGEYCHLDLRRTRISGMPLVRLQNLLFFPLVQPTPSPYFSLIFVVVKV